MTSRLVENWTYADVSAWLRQIGFANYVEIFCRNQIDGEVLLTMSESDLRGPPLNFTVFGQIRKLGMALERLKLENKNNMKNLATMDGHGEESGGFTTTSTTAAAESAGVELLESEGSECDVKSVEKMERNGEETLGEPADAAGTDAHLTESKKTDEDEWKAQAPSVCRNTDEQSAAISGNGFCNESFIALVEQTKKFIPPFETCHEPVMVSGSYLDRVRDMEDLYPDMCWRYQNSQTQLLIAASPQQHQGQDSKTSASDAVISEQDGFMAVVSHLISPAEFYLQPYFVLKKINRLIDDMTEYYKDDMPPVPSDRLYEHMPCAACFREDNKWYRAIVSHIGIEDARIIFVDWGNSQFEPFSGIKPLAAKFGRFPPLTFRCKIDGVRERTLLQKKIDAFNVEVEEVLQKTVRCIPKSFANNLLSVTILNHKTNEDVGQKYLPTEPIIPHSVEFYLEEIRQSDLKQKIAAAAAAEAAAAAVANSASNGNSASATPVKDSNNKIPEFTLVEEKEIVQITETFNPATCLQDNQLLRRELQIREWERKADKLQKGLYASDMEAFLDGAPGFDASDSEEEEMKPKTKRLKQIKREAMLKAQGKWPPPEQNKQINDENRFYMAADGKEYVKDYMKVAKPPKGGQNVVISSVSSAREIFLHTENQLRFLDTLQRAFQQHMHDYSLPVPSTMLFAGTACVYHEMDGMWYRCRIRETECGDTGVPLSMIDYGRIVIVPFSKTDTIKALPTAEHFFGYEVQLFKCKLRYLCEVVPATVESELLRELLPPGSQFFCTFEREREPWRIKLVDPVTQEDVINRFDREMKERHLEQVALAQRSARFDTVALHQKTAYTQQKFDEMVEKFHNTPPLPSVVAAPAANIAAATTSAVPLAPSFCLVAPPPLPHVPVSQRIPMASSGRLLPMPSNPQPPHVIGSCNIGEAGVPVTPSMREPAAIPFQNIVRPTQLQLAADEFEYENDIEAALNGAAIVGGYDEPDVELLDTDDDTEDEQDDRTSLAPLDEATEMKIKKWIEAANVASPPRADHQTSPSYADIGVSTRMITPASVAGRGPVPVPIRPPSKTAYYRNYPPRSK